MSKIRTLREAKGLSQEQLANLVGTKQPTIGRLENGQRKLSKDWAERIAPYLDTTAADLMFDDVPNVTLVAPITLAETVKPVASVLDSPNAFIRGKVVGQGRMIPVYGRAVGGVDGEFEMNGSILYHVMAPPSLSETKGAYAVAVSGDSMSPRYEDGEVCFIDPNRRVRKGDYVVVQIKLDDNGPLLAYVKKFCRRNDNELVLEQFNPPKELRFPGESVESVHYIALAGDA